MTVPSANGKATVKMFGSFLKLDVRGASHAREIRFSLENFPAGFRIDTEALRAFMERRAPGRDKLSTPRRETDEIVFTSGVTRRTGLSPHAGCADRTGRALTPGVTTTTTGAPIAGRIANCDRRPADYGPERTVPRPGHADFGQWVSEGRIPTGGGKNSGRLTAALCAAGGICKQWLQTRGVDVVAELGRIGGKTDGKGMMAAIEKARTAGDSVGGIVSCTVACPPVGLGGALFDGLESELSAALFAIPGVRGVTFGAAGKGCDVRGSKFNDAFSTDRGEVVTATNRHGGILGGRTSGRPIAFDVLFKPTPTVFREQDSVDLATMKAAKLRMKGRHDPCIVRRALPVVEAVAAFVLADAILADEAAHPRICLTLTGKTLEDDLAQYQSERYFTDMVELRLDLLKAKERKRAAGFPELLRTCGATPRPVPVVLTFRRTRDGGAFAGSEETRKRCFRGLLREMLKVRRLKCGAGGAGVCGTGYVDLEDDFHDAVIERLATACGLRIVRSLHAFGGPVPDIRKKAERMVAGTDEIAKIAFRPRTLADVSKLFARRRGETPRPRDIIIAMGPLGLATRVLAGRLGSPWTYASVAGLADLGHVTPHELVRDYRFRTVTREAALYGVTGWPLKKTRSPELHNAAFAAEDEDALMIPFPAKTAAEAIAFMRAMDMRGLAVTIPHKFGVMPLLDKVDAAARRIGAVNTVRCVVGGASGLARGEGRLVGFNTDAEGFAEALVAFAGEMRGRRVAVLGNGGAAQAVKAALGKLGAKYRVFHRETPPQGYDILVNATPVDPIPDYRFTGGELVYDLGYVPEVTPLMAHAAKAGCKVENGFGMLVAQARRQRGLWGV